MEYALKLREESLAMSEEAKVELKEIIQKINDLYDYAITSFELKALICLKKVDEIEDQIDDDSAKHKEFHIDRVGFVQRASWFGKFATVSNLERLANTLPT